jgi:penicillin-binding protein 1A
MGGILFFPLPLGNFRIYAFFEDLENPDSNLATEVISADQVVIGKFFRENRSQLKYTAW